MHNDLIVFGDIEIRNVEKREVWGRIIPYGEKITFRGRPEAFAFGALADVDWQKTKLLDHHRKAIGKMIGLEERQDGAYGGFRVSKTQSGDEMLELVSDGVIDSFSPGFVPDKQDRDGTHTRVKALPEVSLVTFSAYQRANVLAVREKEIDMAEPKEEEAQPLSIEDIDALQKRQDEMFSMMDKLNTTVAGFGNGSKSVKLIRPFEWFQAILKRDVLNDERPYEKLVERFTEQREAALEEMERREGLEDITGTLLDPTGVETDASGLVAEQYVASQLVHVLDTRRPLFASFGPFPAIRSGFARIPVVTQNTQVGKRAGQKEAANSRKLIVETKPFEAEWFDGAVDVALELIRTAELGVLSFVWEDMLGQYAISTEDGVVTWFEAGVDGFVYTGTALPTDTYANFATAVATQAIAVRKATGSPATRLAVSEEDWPSLIAMVDGNDRRILSTRGPQNADSSATFNAESFELPGGITVFYVPGLTQAALYNTQALRSVDYGPERVEATNVELMGRDIGILGRTMVVDRIPAGVVVFGSDPTES